MGSRSISATFHAVNRGTLPRRDWPTGQPVRLRPGVLRALRYPPPPQSARTSAPIAVGTNGVDDTISEPLSVAG